MQALTIRCSGRRTSLNLCGGIAANACKSASRRGGRARDSDGAEVASDAEVRQQVVVDRPRAGERRDRARLGRQLGEHRRKRARIGEATERYDRTLQRAVSGPARRHAPRFEEELVPFSVSSAGFASYLVERRRRCFPVFGEISQISLRAFGAPQAGINSTIASPSRVHPCAIEGRASSSFRSPVTSLGLPPRAETKKANGTSHSAVHCASSVPPLGERNPPLQ
jgi:hypothetical protein